MTRNQDARRPPSGAGRVDNTNVGPSRTGRSLPAAGGTSGGSPRAQNQAAWARDRGAKAQLQRGLTNSARVLARMAGVDRQSQAERKQQAAAQGTRGTETRTAQGRPSMTRAAAPGQTQSQRIQPVQVRDVTPQRRALPPGQRGGAVSRPSSGGAVANREAPRPRPGGRVVVDESPRLPEGNRGGALTRTQNSRGGTGRPARLPADTRGGSRIGNSSQPWGDRPQRTSSPRTTSSRALPPGRPGGPLMSGGARPRVGGSGTASAVTRGAGAGFGRVVGPLATGLEILRTGQKVFNPKDNIVTNVRDLVTAVRNRGSKDKQPYVSDNEAARRGNEKNGFTRDGKPRTPERPRLKPQETREQRFSRYRNMGNAEAPSRPSSSGGGQSGGYTPASPQRPSAGASGGQSERPTRSPAPSAPASRSGGSGSQKWENFNPGRGTSYTNNPLLKNDAYLMSKMKQREDNLPKGPVADADQYGESLKIQKLRKDEEEKKKKEQQK